MDWKLSLAGLLIGLLVGVTGMGGGSLMTPLLVLFFGFKPSIAIGTDIVHGAIFKSFGAVQHRRMGHVHARLAAWILLGSAPFSILGVALAWWLRREYGDGYEDTAKAILGVALVFCGIAFLVKAYLHSSPEDKPFILSNRDRAIAVATGVVGGFVVGLTSVGSGTIFGLVMLIAFPLTAAKIVGTDIFQAAILLAVAGAGHLVAGHVDLAATGWLLIGSVPGVLIGGRLTVKLPDRALRIALAATLTLAGVRLVDPPGADVIVLIAGAVAATLARPRGGGQWLVTRGGARAPRRGRAARRLSLLRQRRRDRAGDELPPGQPVPDLVRRAAGAEAGRRREEREGGDEEAERRADGVEPERVGERGRSEDAEPHHVREARRARVLEAALAEARLEHLEVEDAGEAPPAAERQAERELEREQREEEPPARDDREERHEPDDDLVEARRALVDQLRVAIGVGAAASGSLHFVKYRSRS